MREEKESQIGRECETTIVARQRCHDFTTALSPSKLEAKQPRLGTFTRTRKADLLQQPDGCYVIVLRLGNKKLRTSAGERVFYKPVDRFRSIPTPAVRGAHEVTDLGNSVRTRRPLESAIPHKN